MPRRRWFRVLLTVVVVIGSGAAGWRWLNAALYAPGPLPSAKAVIVLRGSTKQLAQELASGDVIIRPWLFRIVTLATADHGALHAAEFLFPAHASLQQVLAILRTARPVQHYVTIPEGLTAHQIASILAHAEAMTGDVPSMAEAAVLPQTYEYEYGGDRAHLVARAKAAMDKALATAWTDRAAGLPLASSYQALILASIVERETAKPEERPHVAAVYLNRLLAGMRLQADPTIAYAASNGTGLLDHPLTRADLDRETPFNTYKASGLPPTPICSPGLDSLRAVLHPAESADLFFVADGMGGHVFSQTYQAHDAAVARWRTLGTSKQHLNHDD